MLGQVESLPEPPFDVQVFALVMLGVVFLGMLLGGRR